MFTPENDETMDELRSIEKTVFEAAGCRFDISDNEQLSNVIFEVFRRKFDENKKEGGKLDVLNNIGICAELVVAWRNRAGVLY